MFKNRSILLFLIGYILLLQVIVSAHTFKDTVVDEYDQTNLHIATGIGKGKNAIKSDYFIMFYASWCPHCQRFKDTWIQLKNDNKKDNIIAIHCPDNHDLCEQFKVGGYPTLILVQKQKYQYCVFKDVRTLENVQLFWDKKCEDSTLQDIPYTVTGADQEGEEDDENHEEIPDEDVKVSDIDGNVITKDKNDSSDDSNLDESEKKKEKKYFHQQKNKAYEDKIMKFKDYLKKLGPLTIVALIALCILSVTFVCNKCCSYEQEDPFTRKVLKSVDKKIKSGYSQTKNTDNSFV